MLTFVAHTSYQKRFNKVLSFVMGTSKDLFYASHYVMYEMSVCMCAKQQTDDIYIYIYNHL